MEQNNGILRGIKIPKPTYTILKEKYYFEQLKHYSNLETYIPPMKMLFDINNSSDKIIILENNYIITDVNILNDDTIKGNCIINVLHKNNKIQYIIMLCHL